MADRITRASNATAHPGMVDRNPTHRRSKEEVQAEKDAKALAKTQAAIKKKANIERLAALEKAEKQRAKNADWDADDPVPLSQAKVRVSRKRPVNAEECEYLYQCVKHRLHTLIRSCRDANQESTRRSHRCRA